MVDMVENGYGDGGYGGGGGGGYGGGGYGSGGGGYGGGRRGGRGGGGGGGQNLEDLNGLHCKINTLLVKHFPLSWPLCYTLSIMINISFHRSKGFGFVTYKESSMVDDAQSNRPHTIDGREVESKRPMPRDESQKEESKITTERMFIGGCDSNTVNEDSLRENIPTIWSHQEISVIKDKETGKPKAIVLSHLKDSDSVDQCVCK
ncbi:hypothetical protein KUTeg_015532 [Tegillarca granosa]|uniref:Uncharacterized protein n=1 Tax=Tegillarca granosa TaxID=220873 RepID=A0ABQ9EQF6_TEGGR|nr:hypothetical protein KUTeg_015532 [Tegillarca granosa]